jgi:hypothetical protein
MNSFKCLALVAVAGIGITAAAPKVQAQVNISVGVGPACPYGYYDAAPYSCAPYGYYGSEWFSRGTFIGAGPWFHGPNNFQGHVDNRFHPANGYRGATPRPGDRPEAGRRLDKVSKFNGNEVRDGRGHVGGGRNNGNNDRNNGNNGKNNGNKGSDRNKNNGSGGSDNRNDK